MKDSDPDSSRHTWLHDHVSPDLTMMHSIVETLYSGRTAFQAINVINSGSFGLCLVLDGKIQSSEMDEFVYHEALVHPAMLTHPHPEKVFIAGGGEGATLREVLAHRTVRKAVMVDIDEGVVDVCRRFLPSFHQNSFEDPRTELCIADARRYLEESSDTFDVIIIDLVDPLAHGPARLLYTREFYQIVRRRLRPDGIVCVQSEAAGLADLDNFTAIVHTLESTFREVHPYHVTVPSFTDMWGFTCASDSLDPSSLSAEEVDSRASARISGELGSYDGLSHQAMFVFPKHVRRRLAESQRIITDEDPISTY